MNTATKVSLAALVLMGVGVAGVVLVAGTSTAEVVRAYVDNGTDRVVRIELDGKPALDVPPHAGRVYESLKVGRHTVRVLGLGGKVLEEEAIAVPATRGLALHRWVYNVLGASRYKVRYLAYGNARPQPPRDLPEGQRWFELPTPSAVFLPAEPAAEKGRAATTLAVVGHSPVHETGACCANLRALMKP